MTKPVDCRGWPVKRRTSKRNDKGTQTDITIGIDDEVKIVREEKHIISQDENIVIKDKRGIDEGTSMWGQEEEKNIEYESEDEFFDPENVDGEHNPDDNNGDDIDVNLTPGEIKARLKQKGVPDKDGYYECNPKDIELCPVEIRERGFKLKRGLTADSGAGDPVIPKRMINSKKIRPSAGSRRGLHYVSATDHRIPNVGEINLEFQTEEGYDESIIFQVADVNKPLMSISDRVDHNCRVVFDCDEDTGEDLSHVFNKKTKKKMRLNRIGKVWVLNCSVTNDFIAENNPVFIGQGK